MAAAFSIPVDAAPVAAFAAPAPPTAPRPKPSDLNAVLGDFSLEVSRLREEQEQQTSKAREHEGQVEDAALVLSQKRRRLHETEEQIEAALQAEDYDRAERLQEEVQTLGAEVAQSSGTLEALQIESAAHEAKKQELFVRKREAADGVIAILQGLHDKQGAKLARHVDIASARQGAQEAELAARRERVSAASVDVEVARRKLNSEQESLEAEISAETTVLQEQLAAHTASQAAVASEVEELRAQLAAKEAELAQVTIYVYDLGASRLPLHISCESFSQISNLTQCVPPPLTSLAVRRPRRDRRERDHRGAPCVRRAACGGEREAERAGRGGDRRGGDACGSGDSRRKARLDHRRGSCGADCDRGEARRVRR